MIKSQNSTKTSTKSELYTPKKKNQTRRYEKAKKLVKQTCSRVAEWELNWRARAALKAREWAWRWGRRWEMSGGGNLSRRSWIERLREAAFRSSSLAQFCCSVVKTIGIVFFVVLGSTRSHYVRCPC